MPFYPPIAEAPDFIGETIDNGRIRIVEKLGEGAYGIVYRAVDERSAGSSSSAEPRQYAVKILEKANPKSRRWRFQQREVAAHHTVSDHPNIVTLHDVFECQYFVYIVLEYCPGRDLLHALVDRRLYYYQDELLKKIFLQLLDALEYCHEQGVYHRDLKPDNILTNEDGTEIKLADFGLATTAKISDTFGCGSSYYMSPECIGEDYEFAPFSTEASDVWALGVILTNLVAGRNPWNVAVRSDKSYRDYLEQPNYLREMLPISTQTSDILKAIFNPDPVARITIPELRARIREVDTFFMGHEEIAQASKWVKMAAASYSPCKETALDYRCQCQSITNEEDARSMLRTNSTPWPEKSPQVSQDSSSPPPLPPRRRRPPVIDAKTAPKFVIAPSGGISPASSDSSYSEESEGLFTPQTYAQDLPGIEEVPEFSESEKIGEVSSVNRQKLKCLTMPYEKAAHQTIHRPNVIAVPV